MQLALDTISNDTVTVTDFSSVLDLKINRKSTRLPEKAFADRFQVEAAGITHLVKA